MQGMRRVVVALFIDQHAGTRVDQPIFFAYAFPEPDGYRDAAITPSSASFDTHLGEYVLPYDEARTTADPRQALLDFAQSTYEAGARGLGWPVDDLGLDLSRLPGRS